jgi:hypothetical protein
MGNLAEAARLWMLTVISCDEKIGDDGMCECTRSHFDDLAEVWDEGCKFGLDQNSDGYGKNLAMALELNPYREAGDGGS